MAPKNGATMIKSIGHVAFDAYNFEATFDFYTRVLGFAKMFDLKHDDGTVWIVYLRVTDTQFLELFPKNEPAPAEKDRHFSHLCLEVTNIESTVFELQKLGAPIDVEVQIGQDGNKQAWTRDPEGNRIELMEMSENSRQRAAIAWLQSNA